MKPLYILKWPLMLFIVGTTILVSGAWMKLIHWPSGDVVLFMGTIIMILGLIYLTLKLTSLKAEVQPPH